MSRGSEGGILWGAFELDEDGTVRARITRKGPRGEPLREERRWRSLEAAAAELGPGFGELARKVRAEGIRRWRWRP